MPSLLPALASLEPNQEFLVLAIISLGLSVPIIAIIAVFYTRNRREKLWHETARLALEKGQPIPTPPPGESSQAALPPPLQSPPPPGVSREQWDQDRREHKREKDLKGGLIILGIGIALAYADHGRNGMVMPTYVLIGVGAAIVLGVILTRSDHDHRGPPPQA